MQTPERIKKIRKDAEFNMILEIGDRYKVLEMTTPCERGLGNMEYIVENKQTWVCVVAPWNTFLLLEHESFVIVPRNLADASMWITRRVQSLVVMGTGNNLWLFRNIKRGRIPGAPRFRL